MQKKFKRNVKPRSQVFRRGAVHDRKIKKTILYDHVCHAMKILKVKVFIIEFAIYVKALKNGKWVMITQ